MERASDRTASAAGPSPAEVARRQIGRTDVSRVVAGLLVALTGLAVVVPPAVQTALDLAAGRGPLPAAAPLAEAWRGAGGGIYATSRRLLAGLEATEERLEDESWLRERLLPPAQAVLTGVFGVGNEQVVAADAGWLYLAADFAHATGRGFLEPPVLARRARDEGVAPDPLPALADLAADLARRRIALIVVPVPGKAALVPAPLAARDLAPPVQNPSYGAFLERLAAAGIDSYDPTGDLLAVKREGDEAYLRTDTHWTPRALDRVAAAVAARLGRLGVHGRPGETFRRPASIRGRGDLLSLLRLPPGSRLIEGETVETRIVLTAEGDPWRPSAGAEVLLLGDSFTNVYSEAALGWGAGAGLAEQISFHLGAGLDRIARNAGGSERSRAELAAELSAGRDRLAGKKVVVYQFAARELSDGDWRRIALPDVR